MFGDIEGGDIKVKIYNDRFAIVKTDFPIRFVNRDGFFEDDLNEKCIFSSAESANNFRKECDGPEEYRVIRVVVTYEF